MLTVFFFRTLNNPEWNRDYNLCCFTPIFVYASDLLKSARQYLHGFDGGCKLVFGTLSENKA